MKKIYICRDDRTEMLSAIYDAWKENRNKEVGIGLLGKTQQKLFCEYAEVVSSEKKAQAVERLIRDHMGEQTYEDISYALLCEDAMKAEAILHVMQAARQVKPSKRIMDFLGNPSVAKVFEMKRRVSNEAHYFIEFVRFRELENGVLFSEIEPKNRVLTCIAEHFADRFPMENWVIYDNTHQEFLVHPAGKHWVLVQGEVPERNVTEQITEAEKEYEKLWKGFFKTISIKERENLKCQRTHIPVKYRKNVTEFQ